MPYHIIESDGKYCVAKQGEDMPMPGACHPSRPEAEAQMAAMMAKEPDMPDMPAKSTKRGGRHNKGDQTIIDTWHKKADELKRDMAELGAAVEEVADSAPETNALKAISETPDELRVGNYIVLFGGRDLAGFGVVGNTNPVFKNADGTNGEFFTKDTELESPFTAIGRLPVDWEHGMQPEEIERDDVLGYVDWSSKRIDDHGVFVERVLNRRAKYVTWVEQLVKAGLLGTSSESVHGKDRRKATGEITHWPLFRDTLTVLPAEPRMLDENAVAAIKALREHFGSAQASPDGKAQPSPAPDGAPEAQPAADATPNLKGLTNMDEKDIKALQDSVTALTATVTEQNATLAAVKAKLDAPPIPVTVPAEVKDEMAERNPFKSAGDQLQAIRLAALAIKSGSGDIDPRLKMLNARHEAALKALGANEGVGSEGGFLLQETVTNEVLQPLRSGEASPFVSRARKLPVGPNSISGYLNAVDETDRATGSRWGGIRGYRLNEGGTLTKSKPAFRRIQWELKKYAVLMYATDELVRDATQLQSVMTQGFAEELVFMANDDVLNGLGAGGPLGILNAGATVSQAKETGQAAATVVNANLNKMWQRLHPRSRANAAWFINSEVEPQLDILSIPAGTAALEPRYVTYGPDGVLRIKGKPVVVTEFNAALGTVGDIVLADMSEYLFWDTQVEQASSIHVAFLTDESVYRAVYSCEGKPTLLSAITPYKGSNTQSPFVSLATRA